jgi:transcriptional regulator with XRE-family HTH domain
LILPFGNDDVILLPEGNRNEVIHVQLALNVPRLQEYMASKGWDEHKLATEMGVSYVTVYRVVRGQRGVGKEFVAKLLHACPEADFEQLFIFATPLPKGNDSQGNSA